MMISMFLASLHCTALAIGHYCNGRKKYFILDDDIAMEFSKKCNETNGIPQSETTTTSGCKNGKIIIYTGSDIFSQHVPGELMAIAITGWYPSVLLLALSSMVEVYNGYRSEIL